MWKLESIIIMIDAASGERLVSFRAREYLSEGHDRNVDASEPIYTDQSLLDRHRKCGRPT